MKRTREKDEKFRNGDWGPKYLFRGPHCEWGIILLKPGQKMGFHLHRTVIEDFFFLEGRPKILVGDGVEQVEPGDVIRAEPGEKHDILNDTEETVRLVFIKSPYLPDDKLSV